MDRDKGNVTCTRTTTACTAHSACNLARLQRYPLLRWRSRKLIEEIGVENFEPTFVTL